MYFEVVNSYVAATELRRLVKFLKERSNSVRGYAWQISGTEAYRYVI
jgi:hypothetical protein